MRFLGATLFFDRRSQALVPGRPNSFESLFVDFTLSTAEGGSRYTAFLHPKTPVSLQRLELQFEYPGVLPRFFANGFQSRSESRLLWPDERIPRLLAPFRRQFPYGDDWMSEVFRGHSAQHSWTYTFIKEGGQINFLGSLSEQTAYTLFLFHPEKRLVTIRRDFGNLPLDHSFPLLDLWTGEGTEREVFDRYARLLDLPPGKPGNSILGWTSWHRHYSGITDAIARHNLDAVVHSRLPFRYFQIDDGWQTAVGDWLSVKHTFSKGLDRLAEDIRFEGLKPGLWLSPFVAARHSEVVQRHPDWILKDHKKRVVRAGFRQDWGGWFYAMDFYNKGFQEYLSGVFHNILDRWRFELLKLDFLYAVALVPPPGKTRAQVMYDAMDFLQKLAGDREILASGVPLGSAFGKVNYCRVVNGTHLKWENRWHNWIHHRERTSTVAGLRSVMNRWQLDRRVFGSDPDVFILRRESNALGNIQQRTLLLINAIGGSLLFTADDVSLYQESQMAVLTEALAYSSARVESVEMLGKDVYKIAFILHGERHEAWCNLTSRTWRGAAVTLKPYDIEISPGV